MVWTVKWNMHHKYPVHIHNGSNSPIRVSTMMLRSNTRTNMRLTFLLEIPLKLICIENPIILMEIIYPNWCLIPKQLLKLQISHDGFTISKRQFIFNPNNSELKKLYILPPWKLLLVPSHPYPFGNIPGFLTINWSTDTKFPDSYLCQDEIPCFSASGFFLNTPGDSLFSPKFWHYE